MNRYIQIMHSLRDPEYRREFSNDVGTGLAFQIRTLREKAGWAQEELAHRIGKRQETISQWENPDYGRYTLTSLKEIAASFDVALLVAFTSFSELAHRMAALTPQHLAPPSFEEETACGWGRYRASEAKKPLVTEIIASPQPNLDEIARTHQCADCGDTGGGRGPRGALGRG